MNHWRELAPVTLNNRKEEEDVVNTGKKKGRPYQTEGGGILCEPCHFCCPRRLFNQ